MDLMLVRHGQSVGNTKEGFISGQTDPNGLTELGKAQVVRLAWEIKEQELNFPKIITSPVARAHESANIIANLLNLSTATVNKSFIELNYGIFEQKFWWEVIDKIPKELRGRSREDFTMKAPKGESFLELAIRAYHGFLELEKEGVERAILVTHDAVVGSILYGIQNKGVFIDSKDYFRFIREAVIPNAGAVLVQYENENLFKFSRIKTKRKVKISGAAARFYAKGVLGWTGEIRTRKARTQSKNAVYSFKNDENRALFKLLSDKETVSGQRLVKLYSYLQNNTDISAPIVLHYDNNKAFFKDDVLIQDFVIGSTQVKCKSCPSDHWETTFKQVLKIINKIHKIPVSEVSEFWYANDWEKSEPTSWKQYIKAEAENTLEKVGLFDLPAESKLWIAEEINSLIADLKKSTRPLVPLHGDLSPQNLIIDQRENECNVIRVLDFERARIGDPLWDLVYYGGFIDRVDKEMGFAWERLIRKQLTEEERVLYSRYQILFHAWSVRDGLEYHKKASRLRVAKKSEKILGDGERLAFG
jgi:broad specificity phosphatase PhoE/aminoglycoside phosphotransferase (APT) family kinase protein